MSTTTPEQGRAAGVALDLHEGIGHGKRSTACERWPRMLRLASSAGQLVPGRCRSTRQCDYCARLSAVEWAEVFALDAMEGVAPTVYAVTTTRETKPSLDRVKEAKRRLIAKLRERFPGIEYACVVEFTTGRSGHSRGRRFPHWNWLFKGVTVADAPEVERIVQEVWTDYLDAEAPAQWVGPIEEVGGLMRYLALHFLKEDQRPPRWWKGHRVTRSRGYLWTTSGKAHRAAAEALAFKRELWRAEQAGYEGEEAWVIAEAETVRKAGVRWQCVELTVDTTTGQVLRARPIDGGDTVLAPQRPLIKPGDGTVAEWEAVDAHFSRETTDADLLQDSADSCRTRSHDNRTPTRPAPISLWGDTTAPPGCLAAMRRST